MVLQLMNVEINMNPTTLPALRIANRRMQIPNANASKYTLDHNQG
jgi:hypothetical protein